MSNRKQRCSPELRDTGISEGRWKKVNIFFDGVSIKINYEESRRPRFPPAPVQQAGSCARCSPHSGRRSRRVEKLYKKVEKHLCVILQVVWRAMQEEFIRQYNISRICCKMLSRAQISQHFAISDILEYFLISR